MEDIFLQDCRRFTIRNVESRNYMERNHFGRHDVREDCHVHGNREMGCILVQFRSDRSCMLIVWTPITLACSGAGASARDCEATACWKPLTGDVDRPQRY